jgi:hypothetical protein
MGNLSEHFNNSDFACRCADCGGKEYRIHLGLVGALEMMVSHFGKPLQILSGYWCDAYVGKKVGGRKTQHNRGKAVHLKMEGVPLPELFKYAETLPELSGIGYYPQEGFVHLDTRREEKSLWVKEGDKYLSLTPEKRTRYGL